MISQPMAGKSGGGGFKVLRYTALSTTSMLAVSGVTFTEDDVAVIVITKAGAAAVRAPGPTTGGPPSAIECVLCGGIRAEKFAPNGSGISVPFAFDTINYAISGGVCTFTLLAVNDGGGGTYNQNFDGAYDVTVYLKEGV